MDIDLTPTPTKSPDDTEIDTPPHTHTQAIRPLSFTSSEFKNRHHHRPPPPVVVEYKECMKNHAATMGGHAVDGCGEYMPIPSAAPTDPTSLTCAACGCHRNFHRREPDSPTTAITPPFLDFRRPPQAKRTSPSSSPHPPFPYAPPHMLLAFSTAVAADEHHQEPLTPTVDNPVGRKRFRTKFSQEQKEKMRSFSEKLEWKMQKSDEAAVEEFCREVGVAKGVLKVWMHNNKSTFGKKETINSRNIINGRLITFENNINGGNSNSENEEIKKTDNGSHFQNESGSRVHFHDSNNGSCSSP